jgi:hypothetical protein
MPAFEPLCEIDLAEARRLALSDKEFAQRVMSWRVEGASHPSTLNGLFAYGKFAYLDPRTAAACAASSRKREHFSAFSRAINFGLL